MPTKSFSLDVFPDREGRTCLTLTDPNGKRREPIVLGLQGERALYALMGYVRGHEVAAVDYLECWEPSAEQARAEGSTLGAEEIEEALRKCGL